MAYDPRGYQRQKLARDYYRARWDAYFEFGKLFPADGWRQVWKRRKRIMDAERRAADDAQNTDTP